MSKIRLISDLHSQYDEYIAITKGSEYSISLGDIAFDYNPIAHLDSNKHKWIGGNHEDWERLPNYKNFLGRFGYTELNGIKFFFVSGGFSIDLGWRRLAFLMGEPKTWFEDEELNRTEQDECLELYSQTKPDLVLTHEAPRSIVHHFSNNEIIKKFGYDPDTFSTETSELLDRMLNVHRPKEFFFGHFHCDWTKEIDGTIFRCMKELGYYDYEN